MERPKQQMHHCISVWPGQHQSWQLVAALPVILCTEHAVNACARALLATVQLYQIWSGCIALHALEQYTILMCIAASARGTLIKST